MSVSNAKRENAASAAVTNGLAAAGTGSREPSPKQLRIAIVNPDYPCGVFTYHYGLEILNGPVRSSIQTGALPTLAGLLDPRHDIGVFDEAVAPLDLDELAGFDVVAVTGMIVQKTRVLELLAALHGKAPRVVLGGPLVTAEEHLFTGKCDAIFIGEADETWPAFIEDLAAGRPTATRYEQAERTDMSKVPVPRFDLLDNTRYETVSVQFSRGCPFLCEFCDIIVMFGRRPRTKPAENVIAELTAARAAGYRSCFLVDDNFIGNKAAAKELLRAIIDWQEGYATKMGFSTEASVNLAEDEELMSLMVKAGFTQVFVGIESPNAAALLETRKVQNVRAGSLLSRVQRIRHSGLIVRAGFIVGFDVDTPRIFEEQFEFISAAAIPVATVSILSPLPTTPLHKRLQEEGRLVEHDLLCGFEPALMSRDELKSGARKLVARLYDPDNFFDRVFRSFDGPEEFRAGIMQDRARRRAGTGWLTRLDTARLCWRLAATAFRLGHGRVLAAYLRNWPRNLALGDVALSSRDFVRLCILHWHQYRLAQGETRSNWFQANRPQGKKVPLAATPAGAAAE